jgi:hypothetical protein
MFKGTTKRELKKGCMPFCHNPRSSILKVVSIRSRKITIEEEIGRVASRGKKKKR